jgi:hypothetical protein
MGITIDILYDKGIEVFGTKEEFDKWLNNKQPIYGGITPRNLLVDPSLFKNSKYSGLELIYEELIELEIIK